MEGYVTLFEASRILGVVKNTVCMAGNNLGWECKYEGRGRGMKKLYKLADVEALRLLRKNFNTPIKFDRPSCGEWVRALVAEIDALTSWPSDEWIDERTTGSYRRLDIEGVIDERVFRKDAKGKHFLPLREPSMSIDDNRRKA